MNETILIIDDEPLLRLNLRAVLEDFGYQVLEAPDGTEGLALCARHRPDLVLLDIRMPELDGFGVCAGLKANPALQKIPVIFLSGLLDAQDKVRAFRAGGVDYITKPFQDEEVRARVRTHLELRSQSRRLEENNERLNEALLATEHANRRLLEVNERLRLSEEVKGHFLANARNEINNPLSAILALGGELEGGPASVERSRAAGRAIAMEASALDFQLRNLFCAAELEAGEAIPTPASVDAASVVQDALEALRYRAEAKEVSFAFEPGPALAAFPTDAAKLRLIAANLIANAVEFSPRGETVHIRLDTGEDGLTLEVQDHGEGISHEDQALLFERFRQLRSGPGRPHQGQGLGLAVVKALVDLLGGSLRLASEPGRGSTFACTLPAGEAGDDSAADGNLFFFGGAEER